MERMLIMANFKKKKNKQNSLLLNVPHRWVQLAGDCPRDLLLP